MPTNYRSYFKRMYQTSNQLYINTKQYFKLNNIKLDQEIITDPTNIKLHIQQHFSNWTAFHLIDQDIFNLHWQTEYNPKPHIQQDWYSEALTDFSQEEILATLSQLPNNKACRPSGISYEMFKHAGSSFIKGITALLN